jgi:CRISPR-associated protein (TIGR03985 family)
MPEPPTPTADFLFPASTIEYLTQLTSGALRQPTTIGKSMRLWLLLRSLYGPGECCLELPTPFTFADWYKAAIEQGGITNWFAPPVPKITEITVGDCLTVAGIDSNKWLQHPTLRALNADEKRELVGLFPYAPGGKDLNSFKKKLKYDFTALVKLGYLDTSQENGLNQYYRKPQAHIQIRFKQDIGHGQTNSSINALESPDYVIDEYLADFAHNFKAPIAGTSRFFMDLDYVIPSRLSQKVLSLQTQLSQIWAQQPSPPIRLSYISASRNQRFTELVTFPVCLYYSQRACYLCAYGESPDPDSPWYNFRLDKVESLEDLSWHAELPRVLNEIDQNELPGPLAIEEFLQESWGFDFNLPSKQLVLRFPKAFNDLYIKDTERHETFEAVTLKGVHALITKANPPQCSDLLQHLDQHRDDAYYTAQYRANDNKIIMRLRAWGPNVEVLLPSDLRLRMAADIQATASLYPSPP